MDKLKPCPFCGSEDVGLSTAAVSWIMCMGCGCEGPTVETPEESVGKWNTRTPDALLSDLAEVEVPDPNDSKYDGLSTEEKEYKLQRLYAVLFAKKVIALIERAKRLRGTDG